MAAEIKEEFGIDAERTEGATGSFDVFLDGKLIFSKAETGRFPETGEITEIIRVKLGKVKNTEQ